MTQTATLIKKPKIKTKNISSIIRQTVIRGHQAGRPYYIGTCKLNEVQRLFTYDDEDLLPELRAQRTLNKSRIPEMSQYILDNTGDDGPGWIFSAITASIDAEVKFTPISDDADWNNIGTIEFPVNARILINDGQHRRAAIEEAIAENPAIGNESIAVVLFIDVGLTSCQQMFADLNRHAVRTSRSIGVLYDHRDELAQTTRLMVLKSDFFKTLVDKERNALAKRSKKLFTLSAFYNANQKLLEGIKYDSYEEAASIALEYWEYIAKQMPEWRLVKDGKLVSSDVRTEYIHSHGIFLQAMGHVGNFLLSDKTKDWKKSLTGLQKIDWSRSNASTWEGRAMTAGTITKSKKNIYLTSAYIKRELGLNLTIAEKDAELALNRRSASA